MIGVVCTSYPRSPEDPAGSFVRTRVRALARAGPPVEVLSAGEEGETTEGQVKVVRLAGIGVKDLFYQGGAPEALTARTGRGAAWLEALGFTARLTALVARKAGGWDAVESHWLLPSTLAVCAVAPRLRHRAYAHGGDVFLLERLPWGASLAREICRTGVELRFVSRDLRERFCSLCGAAPETWGARASVEPAPVDASVFRPWSPRERQSARDRLGMSGLTVMAAGRLVPIKGFDILVLALARLPIGLRPRLVVAGDGPEASRLRRLARDAHVDLCLTGNLSHADLAERMAAADLFVHPSRSLMDGRHEGAPLVVREALALGIPVIATASGGVVDLAGRHGLILVETSAPEALAREIGSVLASLAQRTMG